MVTWINKCVENYHLNKKYNLQKALKSLDQPFKQLKERKKKSLSLVHKQTYVLKLSFVYCSMSPERNLIQNMT